MTAASLAETYNFILLAFASLAMVCTALNLLVIYRLRMWNGYLLVVTTMAVTQLLYDAAFSLRAARNYETCLLWHYLVNGAGLSTALWTNVLSFVVGYVMLNVRSLSINKCFPAFVLVATALPLGVAVLSPLTLRAMDDEEDGERGLIVCAYKDIYAARFVNDFFYWGRIASIVMNVLSFVFIRVRLHRLGAQPFVHSAMASSAALTLTHSRAVTSAQSVDSVRSLFTASLSSTPARSLTNDSGSAQSSDDQRLRRDHDPQHRALATLVQRMQFYPLCQVVCRSFPAYNEFDDYRFSTPISYGLASAFAPSLGICMFIIFLATQPKAWECFLSFFGITPTSTSTPEEQNKDAFESSRLSCISDMPEEDLELIIDMDFASLRDWAAQDAERLSVPNPLLRDSAAHDEEDRGL